MLSVWQVFTANSKNWTDGCVTGFVTVFGPDSHREKKPERKRKNLIRLGVDPEHVYAWSRSRMGGWAIAQSPILGTTITVERLKMCGYVSLLEIYLKIGLPSIKWAGSIHFPTI